MAHQNDTQSTARIRNCVWGYKCEKSWDGLIATDNKDIRFCDACDKEVYLCISRQELADSVLLNRCVAFPARLLNPAVALSEYHKDSDTNSLSIGEVVAVSTSREQQSD